MLKRMSIFIYGVASYLVFLATFVYLVGFVGNIAVPRSIDAEPIGPFGMSLAIDVLLLGLFAVQHSVMARPAFKRWFTRFIPEAAERSTYVLAASFALAVLFAAWHPLGGVVWKVDSPVAAGALHVACAFGWTLVLVSTFLINHFDLFGLRQVYLNLVEETCWPLEFRTPAVYRYVRHPLYLGFIIALWSTPTMSMAHLVFALVTTLYIFVGIRLEERDLVDSLGHVYREYRQRVPMIIPTFSKARDGSAARRLGNADVH
jgi:protein-S-isoprenylcysteine O-methyltransferase Ste14